MRDQNEGVTNLEKKMRDGTLRIGMVREKLKIREIKGPFCQAF